MNNLNEGPSVLSECFLIKDINLYETIILSDNIKRTSENDVNFMNPTIFVSNISVLLISFEGL
jgi:hypothetical protein